VPHQGREQVSHRGHKCPWRPGNDCESVGLNHVTESVLKTLPLVKKVELGLDHQRLRGFDGSFRVKAVQATGTHFHKSGMNVAGEEEAEREFQTPNKFHHP